MPSLKEIKAAVINSKRISPTKAAAKKSTLSTEYVVDSDAEDETDNSDSSEDLLPLPVKPGVKQPSQTPTSIPPQPKKTYPAPKAASVSPAQSDGESESGNESVSTNASESQSGSDSQEDSSVSSEPESGKGAVSGRRNSPTVEQSKRTSTSEPKSVRIRQPYKAPNGFEPFSKSSKSSSVSSQLFSASALTGKQIWHITAPSSIPVSIIKEVSLESVAKGEVAFQYKGTDYGFVVDAEVSQAPKRLLVPSTAGDGYRSAPMAIAQTLQLQQLVNLPPRQYGQPQPSQSPQGSTAAFLPAKKPIRQQPPGLKMRFRPSGDHSGNPGRIGSSDESSNEAEELSPEFRQPQGVDAAQRPKKRKQPETNGVNGTSDHSSQPTQDGRESKRKKSKYDNSRTTQEPLPSAIPGTSTVDIDSPSKTHSAPMLGKETQDNDTPSRRNDTEQDRKDRKDQKAREKRKAQKAKDRGARGDHHGETPKESRADPGGVQSSA